MVVTSLELPKIASTLLQRKVLSLDTETTGLNWEKNDEIVSIIISDEKTDYYFNFKEYGKDVPVLDRSEFSLLMEPLFMDPKMLWYMHNARFDLHMLARWGYLIAGVVHCTMSIERLLDSQAMSLSLDNVASRYGLRKSGDVIDWLNEHKKYEMVEVPGKKKRAKIYDFSCVPFEVIQPYGEVDGRITFQIGNRQRMKIYEISDMQGDIGNNILKVYKNELQLSKTVFHMEHLGVRLNMEYCKEARAFYEAKVERLHDEYRSITGSDFVDSAKNIKAACPSLKAGCTKKGQDSYDKAALKDNTHPVAKLILEIRATSKVLDFFHTFFYFVDPEGYIHPSLNPAGTRTGRFSCYEPNLQQLKKDDEDALEDDEVFPVRRAFIPSEGHFFVLIDYDQQEYRMMLDYCGAKSIIKRIEQEGLDVHTAMAEEVSKYVPITRKQAKTVNFAIIYGSGIKSLAKGLGVMEGEAKRIKKALFQAVPSLERFIWRVKEKARIHGYVKNWLGRIIDFPIPKIGEREVYYKAPNALIQGGCADVTKVAMNQCDELLGPYKSRMLLCIHDELVFEMAYGEEFLIPRLKEVMEGVYNHRYLKLTAGVEYSEHSLADRKKWVQ